MDQTPSNQHDQAQTRRQKQTHRQIDPSQRGFCFYELTQGGNVIAALLAVNKEVTIDQVVYKDSTEYWRTDGPPANQECSIVNTTVGGAEWGTPPALPDGYSMEGATATLECGTTAEWALASSPAAGWYGTNRRGTKVGFRWVGSTITWYISSAGLPGSSAYVIEADETSVPLVYQAVAPAPGASQAWYTVSYAVAAVAPRSSPPA